MCLPALADAIAGHPNWRAFLAGAGLTLFAGGVLLLGCRAPGVALTLRQTFLAMTLSWVAAAFFSALPFMLSHLSLGLTASYFEAMSGLTTTGATILRGLDEMPPGILLWRSLLQWLGGIGIVILAVSVLPALRIGGMQIFLISGTEPSATAMPRITRIVTVLLGVYAALTLVLLVALWGAGLSPFEALNHAMSAISTGGFSTSDSSVARFNDSLVDAIILAGMVAGGMPFLLFYRLVQRDWQSVLRDDQLRWYAALLFAATVAVTSWLALARGVPVGTALHHGSFTVASVMTGTGFHATDFSNWGSFPLTILFFLTFVGGCAGSTAAGIKIFRFHTLLVTARVQALKLLQPNAVLLPYFNNRPIPPPVTESVMGFLFVYVLCFGLLAIGLALTGLDFMTSLSAAASAIANLGPALGPPIGPGTSFALLPDVAKWLLAFGMLLGRLELFLVLVLFMPAFWRD
jgi:trk system potassium uptake protein TrkH